MQNLNGGLFSALLCEKEYQKTAIQTSCFFLKTNHRLDSANGENAQAYYFSVIIFFAVRLMRKHCHYMMHYMRHIPHVLVLMMRWRN